jgi:hypothetical protein
VLGRAAGCYGTKLRLKWPSQPLSSRLNRTCLVDVCQMHLKAFSEALSVTDTPCWSCSSVFNNHAGLCVELVPVPTCSLAQCSHWPGHVVGPPKLTECQSLGAPQCADQPPSVWPHESLCQIRVMSHDDVIRGASSSAVFPVVAVMLSSRAYISLCMCLASVYTDRSSNGVCILPCIVHVHGSSRRLGQALPAP